MICCIRRENHAQNWTYSWTRKLSGMTSDFSALYWHNHTAVIVQILVPYCCATIWYFFKKAWIYSVTRKVVFPAGASLLQKCWCLWISQHRKCDSVICGRWSFVCRFPWQLKRVVGDFRLCKTKWNQWTAIYIWEKLTEVSLKTSCDAFVSLLAVQKGKETPFYFFIEKKYYLSQEMVLHVIFLLTSHESFFTFLFIYKVKSMRYKE